MQETETVAVKIEEKFDHKDHADSSTSETVAKLLKALKFLKNGISSNPVVPILENVFFKNGVIYAGDLQNYFAHATDIKGEFLVPFKSLFDVLSKLKDKSTRISFTFNKETCKITLSLNGKESFHFAGEYIMDYPKIDIPLQKIGSLHANHIEAIKSILPFASKDELRPAMTGVCIQDKCFVTTDGHRLKMHHTEPVFLSEEEPDFIIPIRAAKCIDNFETIYIKRIEKDVKFESGNGKVNYYSFSDHEKAIIFRSIDEKFPDYKNVVPQKHYIELSVVRKDLMEIIDLALISANKTTHQVRFSPKANHTMEVTSEDLDFGFEFKNEIQAVVTCFEKEVTKVVLNENGISKKDEKGEFITESKMVMTEPFDFGMNGKFFMDILKSHTEDIVVIKGEAANRGFMIGNSSLIMPVMLNQYL